MNSEKTSVRIPVFKSSSKLSMVGGEVSGTTPAAILALLDSMTMRGVP